MLRHWDGLLEIIWGGREVDGLVRVEGVVADLERVVDWSFRLEAKRVFDSFSLHLNNIYYYFGWRLKSDILIKKR